jgi:type II secretory pathway component GspD/PulD (secretin)
MDRLEGAAWTDGHGPMRSCAADVARLRTGHRRAPWLGAAAVAGCVLLALTACTARPKLETETFQLHSLGASQAQKLAEPYVSGSGGLVTASGNPPVMTVRGTAASLGAIKEMLARYDHPLATVLLRYQIIEADGFAQQDSSIADVVTELRRLFRFRGYRLVADAVIRGTEYSNVEQQVAAPDQRYDIATSILSVSSDSAGAVATVSTDLRSTSGRLLSSSVTVADGQTVVLGSARPDPRGGALILVLRPTIESQRGPAR